MRTLIIGGGAAGMVAAIAAAECGERVTVLERGARPLKKLGATGNGRGNLLNSGTPIYYGDTAFALSVLEHMPYTRIRAFLERCGLTLTQEGERVYPAGFLASVAVDALRERAATLGVCVLENTQAISAEWDGSAFLVRAMVSERAPETVKPSGKVKKGEVLSRREQCFNAERLVVAVGGAAAPAHGTDGSAYGLLTGFGHTLTPIRPALCALTTEKRPLAGLSGQRVRAALTLLSSHGEVLHESAGEALFADDGVSGIAAMQLARFIEPNCVLRMDLREAVFGAEAAGLSAGEWLTQRVKERRALPISTLLTGATSRALNHALLCYAGLEAERRNAGLLDTQSLSRLARAIDSFTLNVVGVRGFESAQVTAGGISASEFDPATMESRLQPNLFAVGEVLNVDGDCGGYNLMFAFATALLSMAKALDPSPLRGGGV